MTPRLLRPMIALALASALGGCVSLLPKAVPAELYRFGTADGPAAAAAAAPAGAVRRVVLAPVTMPREAVGDGILTVEGPGAAYLSGARWVAPASVLMREAIDRAFDRGAPAVRLLARGETGRAAGVLTLEVTRFEARYDAPNAAPVIRVAIQARLAGADGAALAAETFDVARPAAANRVEPIVQAYDAATTEALTRLAQWVQQATPAEPAADAGPALPRTETTTRTTTEVRRRP